MWEVDRYVCLGILIILSLIDIYRHEVPVRILISGVIGVVLYHLPVPKVPLLLLAGGVGIGGVFLLVSKATDEGIGYGDSFGIMVLGAYLGLWKIIEVLAGAFLMLGVCSVVILCIRRMHRGIIFPFFPFLTSGYVLVLLAEGGVL